MKLALTNAEMLFVNYAVGWVCVISAVIVFIWFLWRMQNPGTILRARKRRRRLTIEEQFREFERQFDEDMRRFNTEVQLMESEIPVSEVHEYMRSPEGRRQLQQIIYGSRQGSRRPVLGTNSVVTEKQDEGSKEAEPEEPVPDRLIRFKKGR
jgi:hypothetical protein